MFHDSVLQLVWTSHSYYLLILLFHITVIYIHNVYLSVCNVLLWFIVCTFLFMEFSSFFLFFLISASCSFLDFTFPFLFIFVFVCFVKCYCNLCVHTVRKLSSFMPM